MITLKISLFKSSSQSKSLQSGFDSLGSPAFFSPSAGLPPASSDLAYSSIYSAKAALAPSEPPPPGDAPN